MELNEAKRTVHAHVACLAKGCGQPDMCKRHLVLHKVKAGKKDTILNNACSGVGADMFIPINPEERGIE